MSYVDLDPLSAFATVPSTWLAQLLANTEALHDGTGIAAGSITNAQLSTSAGEIGAAWQTWALTFVNVSGGTLNYAKYTQIGKNVFCRFKYTLAGAGVGTGVSFNLPVTAHADYTGADTGETYPGTVSIIDSGTAYYVGFIMQKTTTTAQIRTLNASGNMVGVSATSPFNFGSADFIQGHFMYQAA